MPITIDLIFSVIKCSFDRAKKRSHSIDQKEKDERPATTVVASVPQNKIPHHSNISPKNQRFEELVPEMLY